MKIFNSIHLNNEDKIKSVGKINNFGNLQLEVVFESGGTILIDEAVLNELDQHRTKSI